MLFDTVFFTFLATFFNLPHTLFLVSPTSGSLSNGHLKILILSYKNLKSSSLYSTEGSSGSCGGSAGASGVDFSLGASVPSDGDSVGLSDCDSVGDSIGVPS